jgi:hypothetical protein
MESVDYSSSSDQALIPQGCLILIDYGIPDAKTLIQPLTSAVPMSDCTAGVPGPPWRLAPRLPVTPEALEKAKKEYLSRAINRPLIDLNSQ